MAIEMANYTHFDLNTAHTQTPYAFHFVIETFYRNSSFFFFLFIIIDV